MLTALLRWRRGRHPGRENFLQLSGFCRIAKGRRGFPLRPFLQLYSRSLLQLFNDFLGISGDEQLLVGGDDPDLGGG
ncbi:MAG: hypothetical protein PUC47_09185, partial [Oscillospiraceae bacterium]|nr:hypothetical protein [Oscillospiraceae bacterium]